MTTWCAIVNGKNKTKKIKRERETIYIVQTDAQVANAPIERH